MKPRCNVVALPGAHLNDADTVLDYLIFVAGDLIYEALGMQPQPDGNWSLDDINEVWQLTMHHGTDWVDSLIGKNIPRQVIPEGARLRVVTDGEGAGDAD